MSTDTARMAHRRFVRTLARDALIGAVLIVSAILLAATTCHAKYNRAFHLRNGLHEQWPRAVRPSLALAQHAWRIGSRHHCTGPLGPDRLVLLASRTPHGDIAGEASPGDCTIYVASRWLGGPELCETVLHEAGHVAGLEHSPNPASIMYPTQTVTKAIGWIGHHKIVGWGGVDPRCLDAYGD